MYQENVFSVYLFAISVYFSLEYLIPRPEEVNIPNFKPVPKPKNNPNERIIEVRTTFGENVQNKSPLQYYIDEEGDIANEFYSMIENKLIKISCDKLKKL